MSLFPHTKRKNYFTQDSKNNIPNLKQNHADIFVNIHVPEISSLHFFTSRDRSIQGPAECFLEDGPREGNGSCHTGLTLASPAKSVTSYKTNNSFLCWTIK